MTDALASFIAARRGSSAPWNCSTLAGDWCVDQGHPDFVSRWRTTVDPIACEAAAPRSVDLVHLWEDDIGNGLPVVEEPQRGDIGVVLFGGLFAGGICAGGQWVIAGPRTLHFIAADELNVLKAWHV